MAFIVKEGYEEIHAIASKKLETIDEAVEAEFAKVRAEIEDKFAEDKKVLLNIVNDCVVEVPDEEPADETAEAVVEE